MNSVNHTHRTQRTLKLQSVKSGVFPSMATQSTDQDEILYVSVQRGNTLGSDMPNLAHIGEGVGTESQNL